MSQVQASPGSPVAGGRAVGGAGDRWFRRITAGFALAVLLLIVGIFAQMVVSSWPALQRFGIGFLFSREWDPVNGEFGALPFIWGTLISTLLALLIAVPVSLGAAIFVTELAPPRLRGPVSFLIELLAAVPSVVYGLWGILVMVPWLRDHVERPLGDRLGDFPLFSGVPYGVGMLAAGVILAIMVLPIITAVTRDVLRAVPQTQRGASLVLGANFWETIWQVVLPYGRSGIAGAIVLGMGRALGETMAVTMVIGNRADISVSLFNPAYTLASVLANEFTEATGRLQIAVLIEIALVLFVLTVIVNALARWLVWSLGRRSARG